MATVNKDFKVKNGLIVEGTTATVNNYDILTKKTDDQTYIVNLIGGTATSANEANKVVKRDGSGNFSAGTVTANLVGDVTGNADTATALETARTISLAGDATGSVSFDGTANAQITVTLDSSFATDAEVATAKSEAISAASLDATTKANAAQAAAELTASNALSSAVTTLEGQIADAETDANTYTDNAITALNLAGTYDALGSAATAEQNAKDYADEKVADLVDGAPALLDTLNELAAAIADNPNYATDVANLVAGKQDALTAGSNIAIVNDVISVTGLTSSEISDFNTAALAATAAAYDMYGAAASAQEAAEDYADGLAINYDAAGSASTAEANAATYTDNAINALDTDDIEEGTSNKYFTDARARGAVSAGTGLDYNSSTGEFSVDTAEIATQSYVNTAISNLVDGAPALLDTLNELAAAINDDASFASTITNSISEKVAKSGDTMTGALVLHADPVNNLEAATKQYVDAEASAAQSGAESTAQGALNDVLDGTTAFTAINVNDIVKQVAAEATLANTSEATAVSWAKADYRTAKFLVKFAHGTHTDVSEVLLTLDTSDNVAITEYAIVTTNGSLGSVSADVSGNDVRLRVTAVNASTSVKVFGTLLV